VRRLINDTFLQPDRFRADSDCFIDRCTGFFGSPEGRRPDRSALKSAKGRVGFFAQHFGSRSDSPGRLDIRRASCKRRRHSMAARNWKTADDRDSAAFVEDSLDGFAAVDCQDKFSFSARPPDVRKGFAFRQRSISR